MHHPKDTNTMEQKKQALPNIDTLLEPNNSLLGPDSYNAERKAKQEQVFKPPCPVLIDGENRPDALTDNAKHPGFGLRLRSEHGSTRTHEEKISRSQQKRSKYNPSKPAKSVQQAVPSDSKVDLPNAIKSLPKQTSDRRKVSVHRNSNLSLRPYMNLNRAKVADEYADDTYFYQRRAELKHFPKLNYMFRQTFINFSMRRILIDWLVSVAEEYHLTRQTLFLSVNYIDRFLYKIAVAKDKLQLVGTVCAFIAAKYEEVKRPKLGDFLYISDYAYTQGQLLTMELLALRVLSFDLAVPTIHTFLEHYICVAKFNRLDHKYLSMYLTELALLDADSYLQFFPSIIAAAAFYLAAETLKFKDSWPRHLKSFTGYAVLDFYSCFRVLHKSHRGATNNEQCSVYEKYKKLEYHESSAINPLIIC